MSSRLQNLSSALTPTLPTTTTYLDYLSLVPKPHSQLLQRIDQWCQQHLQTPQLNQCYQTAEFPMHLLKPLQQLDITKYFVGKQHGGENADIFVQGMILAIIASYDPSIALFLMLQAPLCGRTLQRLGSQQQKSNYMKDLIKLNKIWGWALTEEKVGSYASQIETNVRKTTTGGYVLNGNKRWIGNGDGDYLIVYARNKDDNDKINGFIVDTRLPGIRKYKIQHKLGMRCVQNYQLYFDNVPLSAQSLLPQARSYRKGVQKILMSSRLYIIFLTLGTCMGIYRHSIAHCTSRQQFSTSLTSFQLVQQKLVKIMSTTQAIALACWRIASLQQTGENTIGMVAMFKAWVTERARQVSRWGRELMGGNGILHDRYLMKGLMDIETLYTLEGTYEINTLIAGREITGMPAFKGGKSPY